MLIGDSGQEQADRITKLIWPFSCRAYHVKNLQPKDSDSNPFDLKPCDVVLFYLAVERIIRLQDPAQRTSTRNDHPEDTGTHAAASVQDWTPYLDLLPSTPSLPLYYTDQVLQLLCVCFLFSLLLQQSSDRLFSL
jgi:hypothetical protein